MSFAELGARLRDTAELLATMFSACSYVLYPDEPHLGHDTVA